MRALAHRQKTPLCGPRLALTITPRVRTMRLSILLLLTVSVVGIGSASADESVEISAEAIRRHVDYLASPELSGRAAGTSGERRAAEYIAAELERQGVAAPPSAERFQSFPFGRGPDGAPRESRNVLGWIPGAKTVGTGEVIVLGAHFDHLGEVRGALHPGADDNAGGVAAVLEIAAALARKPTPAARSIVVVFFGAEEIGLIGSRYFVAFPPIDRDRIVAMVNIDMLGRPLVDQAVLAPLKKLFGIDDASALGVVGTRGRPFFAEVVESACATVNLRPFGTQNIPLLSVVVENLAKNRSDHAPFERVGIPTIFFGSGESDDYHGPGDTPDKVRVDLVARRSRAIYATVLALAGAAAEKLPPRENAAVPAGTRVETLELARGDLKVLLRDNSRSPKILSGVQSLWNVREASDFDAYDPDAPGASAGLNIATTILR